MSMRWRLWLHVCLGIFLLTVVVAPLFAGDAPISVILVVALGGAAAIGISASMAYYCPRCGVALIERRQLFPTDDVCRVCGQNYDDPILSADERERRQLQAAAHAGTASADELAAFHAPSERLDQLRAQAPHDPFAQAELRAELQAHVDHDDALLERLGDHVPIGPGRRRYHAFVTEVSSRLVATRHELDTLPGAEQVRK